MVEMASTMAVLLLILFAVIDLGRAVHVNTMLSSAAQAGARIGVTTANPSAITGAIESRLNGVDSGDVDISIEREETHTVVTLQYTFAPVTPFLSAFLSDGTLQLAQSARMRALGTFPGP